MMLQRLLRRDDRGIGAVEFALVAPVMIAFIVGVSQVGRLFYANADMKNAIAHGARVASLYPAPEEDAPIIAAVNERLMREGATGRATTTVVRGTDNGNPYIEVRITYSVPLEFIFFSTPPVTLSDSRRVFTQVDSPLENNGDGEQGEGSTSATSASSSATSASSTTSSGDPGSTSATSSGDPGSTTSASSSGDSSSTSASSTTSASSSGSNGSSGSNNGSSGHNHGNCNKKC